MASNGLLTVLLWTILQFRDQFYSPVWLWSRARWTLTLTDYMKYLSQSSHPWPVLTRGKRQIYQVPYIAAGWLLCHYTGAPRMTFFTDATLPLDLHLQWETLCYSSPHSAVHPLEGYGKRGGLPLKTDTKESLSTSAFLSIATCLPALHFPWRYMCVRFLWPLLFG